MEFSNYTIRKINTNDEKSLKEISLLFRETDFESYKNKNLYTSYDYYSEWSSPTTNRSVHFWASENKAGLLLGAILLKYKNTIDNASIARIDMRVRKDYRRNKIGTCLLYHMAIFAKKINRVNITVNSNTLSDAAGFLKFVGAEKKDLTIEKFIDLKSPFVPSINFTQLPSQEYKATCWENDEATELLEGLTVAKQFLDDRNVGLRKKEYWSYSKDWLIQEGITRKRTLDFWWTFLLFYDISVIGYCEIEFYKDFEIAYLADIAIHPKYRKKGLAKWLTHQVIKEVKEKKENIRYIKTLNGSNNTAINRINDNLGFFENNYYHKWQLNLNTLSTTNHENEKI